MSATRRSARPTASGWWSSARAAGLKDGFEWFCPSCHALLHRVEVQVADIVRDLPPLFDAFHASVERRTCRACGTLHPGK